MVSGRMRSASGDDTRSPSGFRGWITSSCGGSNRPIRIGSLNLVVRGPSSVVSCPLGAPSVQQNSLPLATDDGQRTTDFGSIPKSTLASNFVKKNAGSSRHINRIHPRANGNTQEQGSLTGNLRWQAGSLSSHHDGERASQVRLVKRRGAVTIGGDDANLSRAQAIQEFIGSEARQDRKAEDRAR